MRWTDRLYRREDPKTVMWIPRQSTFVPPEDEYEEVGGWRFWWAWLNMPRVSIAAILVWALLVLLIRNLLGIA